MHPLKQRGAFEIMNYFADKNLAVRYQVTRQTIWRWVREGNLPAPIRLGKAAVRWNEADILAWEQAKKAGNSK